MIFRTLLLAVLLQRVSAYSSYQARIPNGDSVPHPCKPNNIWEGVGHILDGGTGARNPFGQDFFAAGKQWTVELCRKDSDGDGMTNGQELGDPDCTWTINAIPSRLTGLSHPGVCEPWDSPACFEKPINGSVYKNQEEWMREICKPDQFVCPALSEPGVKNISVHLPAGTKIYPKETTYICQVFDLEKMIPAGDYHMVAVEPIIDNKYAIHHMVLFGCNDDEVATSAPFECGMVATSKCQNFLSVWTVGFSGDCNHPSAGVRLGTNGYKRLAIQIHWNNPDSRNDWYDSSGLLLHYTPNRRPYDAGIVLTGSSDFVIPPRQAAMSVVSTCTSGCTRSMFKGQVQVTMAWNHMHYAGIKMSIRVNRNKTLLTYLTNDNFYSYDSPQVYLYNDQPIVLLPGDELITNCTYTTSKKNHSTLQGEATSDEMCFGFLTYFPKSNVSSEFCLSAGPDISLCDSSSASNHGCPNIFSYYNNNAVNASSFYRELVKNCMPFSPCLRECIDYLVQQKTNDACLRGDVFEFIQKQMLNTHNIGHDMMARMASCETEVYLAMNSTPSPYVQSTPRYYNDVWDTTPRNKDDGYGFSSAPLTGVTSLLVALLALLPTVIKI